MRKFILITLVFLTAAGGYLLADWYRAVPVEVEKHFVGRESCIDCHQQQAALFHGSDHDLAMDLATDESVLANFDDQSLEHYGVTSRMFRDGEKFIVHTEGPDGEMSDFEVKYVFGVRPLQQYMVELDRPDDAQPHEVGRVQVLRLSWDTNAKKWFYLKPPDVDEKIHPTDPLHWTGITQNWNASCAVCHSTNLKKNFDPLVNNYRTTFSEIDVSCEACHGEGSLHVELARQKSLFWDRNHQYGLVKLKTESNLPQIETCAPCHSRRTMLDEDFRPGCNFDDYFATQLLTDRIYHADGQIRDENYVYGSFVQSKMFHNGIRCTDCHDPHSTRLKYEGNQVCTSCHQHPAGKYDTPNHHHHEPGTPGASCVECHMPSTTYMMVDPRRDHSFRVPRPDLSVQLGTPNACSACHIDATKLSGNADRKPLTQYLDWIIAAENGDEEVKTELERVDQWMLEATQKWYPEESSQPKTKYYADLAIGRSELESSTPTLVDLSTDRSAPAIIRASALNELMEDDGAASLAAAIQSLESDNAKIVSAALMRIDMEINRIADRVRYGDRESDSQNQLRTLTRKVAGLLSHRSKRVRIEAARVFAGIPPDIRQSYADPEQRQQFLLAIDEYKKSLYVHDDRAANHLMLGGLHEMLGDVERAKDNYRTAINVEPNLAGPRSNLAALLEGDIDRMQAQMRQSQSGGGIAAGTLEAMIKQIRRLAENAARLRAEEHGLLATDIQRSEGLPDTHGLHYRFAMSSYVQGDLASTEKHLLEAHSQLPDNPMYLMGLATYYVHVKKPDEASTYVQALIEQDPRHPGYQALAEQVQQLRDQTPKAPSP